MDSTRKISLVTVDDEEPENIKDNGQLMDDIGCKEDPDDNGPKSLIMEIYPWISQFKKTCRNSLGQRSMESLKNLMTFYSRQIRPSVNECHTKPLRADKLKDSMSDTLLFFLYYYRDLGKDQDRASYMDLMSDLLAMYIDMELKASKKGNEHHSKISARLSSCLHVYLQHSAEHLLDTLLKVHFMTWNYHEILDPLITKIFKGIQEHPSSSIMYVRYLLAFRLWKKLNKDVTVRNQINVTALSSLGTAPAEFHPFVIEYVLPKVPKTQKLTTKLLLLYKFEVEKSCEEFLNFCKKERGLDVSTGKDGTSLTDTVTSAVPEDNNSRDIIVQDNVENVSTQPEVSSSSANLFIQKSLNNENDTNSKRPSVTKSATSAKLSSLRRAKKSKDIVFIDLTSDSATEKVIRQKKTRRKLLWLQDARKRVSAKSTEKKNSTAQNKAAASEQQLENTIDLCSLRIESPRSHSHDAEISGIEEIHIEHEDTTTEERRSPQTSAVIEESMMTDRTSLETTNTPDNTTQQAEERSDGSTMKNEKTPTEEMTQEDREKKTAPRVSVICVMETGTESIEAGNSKIDELLNEKKIDDKRDSILVREESHGLEAGLVLAEKDKTTGTCPVSVEIAIKAEYVSEEQHEIINEEVVSRAVELPIAEYASEVSLRTSGEEKIVDATPTESKIREVEFQDNIDGLSLLASVSQRVSHLTTTPTSKSNSVNGDLIKVKNYASLANLNAVEEPDTSTDALPFCGNPASDVINRIVGIYPEDAMDKVAFEVEVSSSGAVDLYEECEKVSGGTPFISNNDESCCIRQLQGTNAVPIPESTTQTEMEDTNVILNGETVVLFQKSPNSNLYIINKAVENRDHANDEVPGALRELTEHAGETGAFTYECYDNMYHGQPTPYDLTQYNRELSTQENRRGKKGKLDTAGETNKGNDPCDLIKSGKKKTLSLEVIGKGSPGKRKSPGNSGITRRRRIKQEYNGCPSNLPGHLNSNYGIQECSQEHVETAHSIHMPVTHTSPLSSIYSKYPAGAELYLPCHNNCSSMTCGLPVDSAAGLRSHPVNASGGGKSHCSCLNCAYGIVAHCTECILPSGETRASTIDNTSYYLPIHSTVQNSTVQDCSRTNGEEPLVKMYDEQLVCKLQQTILDTKPLSNVGVKCEPEPIYRAEVDNKLPLKKRFKAMMSVSFDEISIKREKAQSYPGTPMLSIAALDAQDALRSSEGSSDGGKNALELSPKCRVETHGSMHYSREMIRCDYRKDMMISSTPSSNGHHNGGGERKRKRRSAPNPLPCNVDEVSYKKACKTSVKHKQTTTTGEMVSKRLTTPTKSQARPSEKVKELDAAPVKKSTRQTRSSKRNVPKVNYIYTDGDSDWNPSGGGYTRKRKKTTR